MNKKDLKVANFINQNRERKLGDVLAITGNLRQGQEPLNYELGLTYIAKSHFLLLLERRDLSRKAKSHLL